MKREYRNNPSFEERRTPEELFNDPSIFTNSERKAVKSMTNDEIKYLRNECHICEYVAHLRKGDLGLANGSDFPILVAKGSKLQLERFKMIFLLSLIDFKGVRVFHPVDFQIGRDSYVEAQEYTGVAIIKIPYGSSTTENFDKFRSDLITDVLTVRRENFNPTIILTEQSIAGALNTSFDLIKVVELDPKKLRGSYDGSIVKVDTTIASRKRETPAFVPPTPRQYAPPRTEYREGCSSSYNSKYNKKKSGGKESVNDKVARMRAEQGED